jgi:hypothetical protein
MTFILRWPTILVLLALVLLSAIGALAAGAVLGHLPVVLPQVQGDAAEQGAAQQTWIDVALLGAAALFFLISAIRLMRRTQGFWTWLFGFACYGGRWAWAQQQSEGGALATLRGVDINAYKQPQAMLNDLTAPEAQVGLLAIVLVVGLLILIVDAVDRAHWDKQGA